MTHCKHAIRSSSFLARNAAKTFTCQASLSGQCRLFDTFIKEHIVDIYPAKFRTNLHMVSQVNAVLYKIQFIYLLLYISISPDELFSVTVLLSEWLPVMIIKACRAWYPAPPSTDIFQPSGTFPPDAAAVVVFDIDMCTVTIGCKCERWDGHYAVRNVEKCLSTKCGSGFAEIQ